MPHLAALAKILRNGADQAAENPAPAKSSRSMRSDGISQKDPVTTYLREPIKIQCSKARSDQGLGSLHTSVLHCRVPLGTQRARRVQTSAHRQGANGHKSSRFSTLRFECGIEPATQWSYCEKTAKSARWPFIAAFSRLVRLLSLRHLTFERVTGRRTRSLNDSTRYAKEF